MNKPITSRIQQSTQGGMKVTKPILNVGVGSCGCDESCKCGSPAKMYSKSPSKKALVGNQKNLPKEIKDKILAAPGKYGKSMAKKKGCKGNKY